MAPQADVQVVSESNQDKQIFEPMYVHKSGYEYYREGMFSTGNRRKVEVISDNEEYQ